MQKYLLILIVSAIIRLPYLTTYPPGGPQSIGLRFLTAFAGIVSIILFTALVNKFSHNSRLAFMAGLTFAFMPWHIEQSRVLSEAMWGLSILLFGFYISTLFNNKLMQGATYLMSFVALVVLFPDLVQKELKFIPIEKVLENAFRLTSGEFLFFKNDTFWQGGLRSIGVFLPSMIPAFVIGLGVILRQFHKKYLAHLFVFIALTTLASLNKQFPEGREFFLITPYLALISGFGVYKIFEFLQSANIVKKIVVICYISFILYDYILFFHTYTIHYTNRIRQEFPYAEIDF